MDTPEAMRMLPADVLELDMQGLERDIRAQLEAMEGMEKELNGWQGPVKLPQPLRAKSPPPSQPAGAEGTPRQHTETLEGRRLPARSPAETEELVSGVRSTGAVRKRVRKAMAKAQQFKEMLANSPVPQARLLAASGMLSPEQIIDRIADSGGSEGDSLQEQATMVQERIAQATSHTDRLKAQLQQEVHGVTSSSHDSHAYSWSDFGQDPVAPVVRLPERLAASYSERLTAQSQEEPQSTDSSERSHLYSWSDFGQFAVRH